MTRVVFRRIVCAVDLSDQAAPSLERALQLAQLHGGELLVVHVTNGRLATESDRRTVTDAFSQLQRLTKIASQDRVPVRWIMASGNPAMELARFVRSTDSDLAIVGRALPRPSTGVLGTVADAILRTTACPVLVMPRTPHQAASPNPYHGILCGVSSGLSTATLRYALSFAQEFQARLTILTVEDLAGARRTDDGWLRADIDRLRAEIPDSARKWSVIDERVANGEAARELVTVARELDTDLVVVGSTSSPGTDGGLGSAALGALTLTDASVLIVPNSGIGMPTSAVAREVGAIPAG